MTHSTPAGAIDMPLEGKLRGRIAALAAQPYDGTVAQYLLYTGLLKDLLSVAGEGVALLEQGAHGAYMREDPPKEHPSRQDSLVFVSWEGDGLDLSNGVDVDVSAFDESLKRMWDLTLAAPCFFNPNRCETVQLRAGELLGDTLDWAALVARHGKHDAGNRKHVRHFHELRNAHVLHQQARFSTSWLHAGPIIAGERIHMSPIELDGAEAWQCWVDGLSGIRFMHSEVLVAAMRSFVHAKLGDTVEVPASLAPAVGQAPAQAAPRPRG